MRTLIVLTALLSSLPAFGARYVRYDCLSYYYDEYDLRSYHHGCSAWYSPTAWSSDDARKEAIDASLEACRQDSGDSRCFFYRCTLERTDLYSPSWSCPLD